MKTQGTTTKHDVADGDGGRRVGRPVAILLAAYLLASLSLLLWVIFLSRGSLKIVDLGLSSAEMLLFDAALSFIFFAQHSVMVRASFKKWMGRWIRQDYHGAVYAIASGVVLSGLALLWQGPVQQLIVLGGIPGFAVGGTAFVALAGFMWGIRSLGGFDMFGTGPIVRLLRRQRPSQPTPLTVRGAYRWVRHPLYLFCLMAIWSATVITVDRLLYNVMWTGWIIVGTMLEERDLVTAFGDTYRTYRATVPMLIPWRRPDKPTSTSSIGWSNSKVRNEQ